MPTRRIAAADIGWEAPGGRFVDLDLAPIRTLQHLYPWEWLVQESFGRRLLETEGETLWIEPIWKMIWSNKAILPILWELFPGHPNLLWASAQGPLCDSYAQKPILAREGANVRLVRGGVEVAHSGGAYADSPSIWQELYELPDFEGARPVIGSWVVDGAPAGMGIREDGADHRKPVALHAPYPGLRRVAERPI